MYTEPALTPRSYWEILNRRPLEALVYREISDITRLHVDRIANSLLKKLQNHPYVAIHGDQWKMRFSIREGDATLEAIQKIYSSLHGNNDERHYPTLALNSFEKLYREDLMHRDEEFRRQTYLAIGSSKELSDLDELKNFLLSLCAEPESPELFLRRIILDLKKAGCAEILWRASAIANYWEAIPFLFDHQVSWIANNGYAYPAVEQTGNNSDWIAAFNARSQVKIPLEHEVMSLSEAVRLKRGEIQARVWFFCERLSLHISEWSLQDGQDSALWYIDQYAKQKIDEQDLALNLAKSAAKHGWGNHLWRLIAATGFWEAIPILLKVNIPIPQPDAEEPRTILKIAEQTKSEDWIHAFLFHTR